MKEQIERVVLRRKFVAGDSDEARKTATGHSCKTLINTPLTPLKRGITHTLSAYPHAQRERCFSVVKSSFKLNGYSPNLVENQFHYLVSFLYLMRFGIMSPPKRCLRFSSYSE
jgi:hypothetical protein